MSSSKPSKIHSNSKGFKPEDIVKHKNDTEPGWRPLPTSNSSFETQETSLPSTEPGLEPPVESKPAEPSSQPEQLSAEQQLEEPVQVNEQAVPNEGDRAEEAPAAEAEVDLSNFIELQDAEKRIEEAYQKGLREGREKVEEDYVSASKAMSSACQQLDIIRETIINNSGKELQNFALAIAEKIIRISVQEQDRTILATIKECLQRAVRSDEVTIYVHPDDYNIVLEKSSELISNIAGLNNIVIRQDISVERGGTKVESENCTVDASVAGQFAMIREEVKKRI